MTDSLRLTKPYMHGPAVTRVQELLKVAPQDGIYGPATCEAVRAYQSKHGIEADGIVGPATWALIRGKVQEVDCSIVDIRDTHARPRLYGKKRNWSNIIGVTLHQTGCNMPADPQKWRNLNAHYGITKEGVIVWANDETDMIWHGNNLSQATIGVEIEGNFEGVSGLPATLWKGGGPACYLTDAQLMASGSLFVHLSNRFVENDSLWRKVYAHRQSSGTRRGDPGSEIWQKIALPWIQGLAMPSMDGGPEFHLDSGKPIPDSWDSSRIARF